MTCCLTWIRLASECELHPPFAVELFVLFFGTFGSWLER